MPSKDDINWGITMLMWLLRDVERTEGLNKKYEEYDPATHFRNLGRESLADSLEESQRYSILSLEKMKKDAAADLRAIKSQLKELDGDYSGIDERIWQHLPKN
jgi:hypothetical protein